MRPAAASDATRLSALATQVFLHTYATEGVNDNLAEYVAEEFAAEEFARRINDPSRVILVAELDDALIGYVEVIFDEPCPERPDVSTEVATLYVSEHFARRGIGSALLGSVADLTLRRTGSRGLWLTVYAGNPAAQAFYTARGFGRVGTAWFELGTGVHENHVLVSSEASQLPE